MGEGELSGIGGDDTLLLVSRKGDTFEEGVWDVTEAGAEEDVNSKDGGAEGDGTVS